MKNINYIIFISALVLFAVGACSKTKTVVSPVSINIIHAMPDGNPILPVFGNEKVSYYSSAQTISYGGYQLYSQMSNDGILSVVSLGDTSRTIYKETLSFMPGYIYSLFMAGDTIKPDVLLSQDTIPLFNDSSVGVRFVNLSIDKTPLSIAIEGNVSPEPEFSSMQYLKISSFKKYSANSLIPGNYTFEVRDDLTGDVLTTFTWTYVVSKSNTLVISGSKDPNSSTPMTIFPVNNY